LASITFTDAGGTATLDNGLTAIAGGLGSRFTGWVPFQRPIGPMATALGTGRGTRFIFRTDYGASFTINELPNTAMATMLRLQAHLLAGGLVTVTTGDAANRTYTNCCLTPDGDVTIEMQDSTLLTYSMSFTLLNLGGAAMLCEY
jgi:hypothetical protein